MNARIGNSNNANTHLSSVDNHIDLILDGILGSGGATRETFDKDYDAYMAGQYYAQDKRDRDSSNFAAALEAAGFNAGDVNNPAVLNTLQSRMLNAINTAMGVNGIADAQNKSRVSDMNEYLITQWQDIAQARAVKDDITGLGYNNYISRSGSLFVGSEIEKDGGNQYAMVPLDKESKAAHLDSVFDQSLLKNGSKEIAMA
jgi:hypothetical protein